MGGGADGRAAATVPESLFIVTAYNAAAKLAHTPAGTPDAVGVYTVALDTDSGRLSAVAAEAAGPNPAFALQHPTLPVVYVSTERIDDDGEVMAYAKGERGELRLLSKRSAGGKSTCFLYVHPSLRYLICVSYWDAKVTSLPLAEDGSLLPGAPSVVLQQPRAAAFFAARAGEPVTREEHWRFRQRWPHSHCVVQEPYTAAHQLFVTDLGLDCVSIYELDAASGHLVLQAQVQLDAGRGPRHLLFHPRARVAYVGNELDSTVTALAYTPPAATASAAAATVEDAVPTDLAVPTATAAPAEACVPIVSAHAPDAPLRHLQTLSSLPEEAQGKSIITPEGIWKAASHSSELRLRPDGRYLYVGNRGHDSIAIYAVDEAAGGTLRLVDIASCGGACPRNFGFSRCGRFLVVGNQNSSTLVSFACDADTGLLSRVDTLPLPSPNYVYSLPR